MLGVGGSEPSIVLLVSDCARRGFEEAIRPHIVSGNLVRAHGYYDYYVNSVLRSKHHEPINKSTPPPLCLHPRFIYYQMANIHHHPPTAHHLGADQLPRRHRNACLAVARCYSRIFTRICSSKVALPVLYLQGFGFLRSSATRSHRTRIVFDSIRTYIPICWHIHLHRVSAIQTPSIINILHSKEKLYMQIFTTPRHQRSARSFFELY